MVITIHCLHSSKTLHISNIYALPDADAGGACGAGVGGVVVEGGGSDGIMSTVGVGGVVFALIVVADACGCAACVCGRCRTRDPLDPIVVCRPVLMALARMLCVSVFGF